MPARENEGAIAAGWQLVLYALKKVRSVIVIKYQQPTVV